MTQKDAATSSNTGLQGTLLSNLDVVSTNYADLCSKQLDLELLLERAKEEEETLLSVLATAEKATPAQAPTKQDQERQTMKRLEEALMGNISSDEESEMSG